jgi:pimeloyl-ACP methyl ester carboxylesterase
MTRLSLTGRFRPAMVGLVLGMGTMAVAPLAAQVRVPPLVDRTKAASSEAYCPQSRAMAPGGLRSLGRISCSQDPTRPVIILVHGLHQSLKTWTEPSNVGYAYDYSVQPGENRVGDTHDKPNAGIYKIGLSPWLYGNDQPGWDRQHNWFDFLAQQGFTVATWSQPGTSLADAWSSAAQMVGQVLNMSRDRNPGAPPPVALIGHSRGGLLIRKLLKEQRTLPGMERVRWVVTLNSPHQGTELGRYPGRMAAETVDLLDCCVPQIVTAAFKPQLKDLVTEAMRPLSKILVDFESRELIPDGPLLRDLTNGEAPMPGVKYYTFGGTNPTYYRLYAWMFDAMSAVPQLRGVTTYFVWRVKPVELTPISPVLDGIRDFVPEVTVGAGDGLVSDARARLPWSTHFTTKLNHAEVLWDRPLQLQVLRLIEPGGRTARP